MRRRIETKYQEQVSAPLKPSLLENFSCTHTDDDQKTPNNYYMLDRSNKAPDYYFTLNSDVLSFAKNYEQILRIQQNAVKTITNKKAVGHYKSKSIHRRLKTDNDCTLEEQNHFLPLVGKHKKCFSHFNGTFLEGKNSRTHNIKLNKTFRTTNVNLK